MQLACAMQPSAAARCSRQQMAQAAAPLRRPAVRPATAAVATPSSCPSARHGHQQQQPRLVPRAAAADAAVEAEQLLGPEYMELEVAEMLEYAIQLACAAETYEIHSWMLLLAVLKHEGSTAAQVLVELGLDDLYGAWHEVLWALQVSDGLLPRAFRHRIEWGLRARAIAQGSVKFAGWAGRDKVQTQDLLLAFAASDVLSSLFPDVDMNFDRVKRTIEKRTGETYQLPNYDGGSALDSQDMFL